MMGQEQGGEEGREYPKVVLDSCQKEKKGAFVNGHLKARGKHVSWYLTPKATAKTVRHWVIHASSSGLQLPTTIGTISSTYDTHFSKNIIPGTPKLAAASEYRDSVFINKGEPFSLFLQTSCIFLLLFTFTRIFIRLWSFACIYHSFRNLAKEDNTNPYNSKENLAAWLSHEAHLIYVMHFDVAFPLPSWFSSLLSSPAFFSSALKRDLCAWSNIHTGHVCSDANPGFPTVECSNVSAASAVLTHL